MVHAAKAEDLVRFQKRLGQAILQIKGYPRGRIGLQEGLLCTFIK